MSAARCSIRNLVHSAMDGIDEVYHLAGLPGMWLPRKDDFHTVNYGGTEIVIETARRRGVKRFLHCSTESILFRSSPSNDFLADNTALSGDMPGPYTRSKMLAERLAMQVATSGYPVVIGCPTMPIGPHDHNVTPPTGMLRHFLDRLGVFNCISISPLTSSMCAMSREGLILAMERGQSGHRYILGGETIPLKQIARTYWKSISGRRARRLQVGGRRLPKLPLQCWNSSQIT